MNLENTQLTKVAQPIPDWIVKADITDDAGNVIADFGPDGTSVNEWWNQQTDEFQREYVLIFISIMANQIAQQ